MDYKYSASSGGFYPADDLEMYGENLPGDLVDVDEKSYAELFAAQAVGRRIIADEKGNPVAEEQLPPSREQLQAIRDSLLRDASTRIAPLQDAVDLGIATIAESASLTAWKHYRVALNRFDLTAAQITWPVAPA